MSKFLLHRQQRIEIAAAIAVAENDHTLVMRFIVYTALTAAVILHQDLGALRTKRSTQVGQTLSRL